MGACPDAITPARVLTEAGLAERHAPGVYDKMKNGRVAVAGLGGLGSNAAVMLARMGVGSLLLVDYDVVEPHNLNRQHYAIAHLYMKKTAALECQIHAINPFVHVETRDIRVIPGNAPDVFAGYPIVIEAFDDPSDKASLVEALLAKGGFTVIAASGMAGLGGANGIVTRRLSANLYVCGDFTSEADAATGVMAPRVSICAGHQANAAVRLILGMES